MSTEALTRQFLEWIGTEPRGYVETMDAWRTSCPRLTIWEDALSAGLIRRVPGATIGTATVQVTEAGRALLREEHVGPGADARSEKAGNRLPTRVRAPTT